MDLSDFFHRPSSSGTQDHWNVGFPRSYSGGNLSIRMEDTLHPDRGQKHRSLELMTEDSCLVASSHYSNRDSKGELVGTSKLRAVQLRSMRGIMAHLLKALRFASWVFHTPALPKTYRKAPEEDW